MPIKVWKLQSEEIIHSKYGRQVVKRVYRMPDGRTADYYIKKEKNSAGVLALTKDRRVILVRQYRPGPDRIVLNMPGGYIDDPGSDPKLTAERELLEETGFQGKTQFVATCIDDGYSTVERHIFVATDCEKVAEPELEPNEFLETVFLSIEEFRQLLRSGQTTNVEAGYLALDYLDLL